MRRATVVLIAGLALALVGRAASAHHAFAAEFDVNKPVTLKGKVTKVELINPHGWLYIDVVGPDGTVTNWAVETTGPNQLLRRGWRKETVQIGFDVIVQGYSARDGSPTANGTSVTLPNGQKLFLSSTGTGAPEEQPKKN
jgi:hypothetical protein